MKYRIVSRFVTVSVVELHYYLPLTTLRLTIFFLSVFFSLTLTSCDTFSGKNKKPAQALSPIDSISELITANPERASLYNERALLYIDKKDFKSAKIDASKAINLDSTISEYYVTLADAYFTNEPKECVASLKKAISLDHTNIEALRRISELYLYVNRLEESLTYANQILELDPNYSKAFEIKGMCYKLAGDTVRAILNFREAVDKDPQDYNAYMMLAQLHNGLKDKLAVTYYNNALSLKPKSLEAYYGLAMFYQETGELNRAIETYSVILTIDPNYKNAHFNLGYIHFNYLKNYNQALKHFDDAVKSDASYYEAVYMRGVCYETLGDIQRAKGEYTRALQINPAYKMALDGMNRVLK